MKKYHLLGGPALHSVFSQIILFPQIQFQTNWHQFKDVSKRRTRNHETFSEFFLHQCVCVCGKIHFLFLQIICEIVGRLQPAGMIVCPPQNQRVEISIDHIDLSVRWLGKLFELAGRSRFHLSNATCPTYLMAEAAFGKLAVGHDRGQLETTSSLPKLVWSWKTYIKNHQIPKIHKSKSKITTKKTTNCFD